MNRCHSLLGNEVNFYSEIEAISVQPVNQNSICSACSGPEGYLCVCVCAPVGCLLHMHAQLVYLDVFRTLDEY